MIIDDISSLDHPRILDAAFALYERARRPCIRSIMAGVYVVGETSSVLSRPDRSSNTWNMARTWPDHKCVHHLKFHGEIISYIQKLPRRRSFSHQDIRHRVELQRWVVSRNIIFSGRKKVAKKGILTGKTPERFRFTGVCVFPQNPPSCVEPVPTRLFRKRSSLPSGSQTLAP